MTYPRRFYKFPCVNSMTFLFIYSKCNILHLLSPSSQSMPLPIPLLLATISLFSVCDYVSVS